MPDIDTPVISCKACQRNFAWKPALAGKKVKCKCGAAINVPLTAAAPEPAATIPLKAAAKPAVAMPMTVAPQKRQAIQPAESGDLDGLYALADDAEHAAAALPIEVMEFAPEPAVAATTAAAKNHSSIPLGYQRGSTAREKEKALAAAAALVDPVRDLYAPIGILVAGFAIHLGYYIFRYHLGAGAVVPVGIGVVILTAIKAALLVGFAFVMAGPLGVSFGGIWSAILKLAAIAVFTDGATAWVDFGIAKISGGFGGGSVFGPGMIGFPVSLGLYWALLIYLFSMDPGDSWMVVVLLSVFDWIVRTVLMLLLLEMILGWGGVTLPASAGGSGRSSSIHASALATEVDDLKQADALVEARRFIIDGHQGALLQPVNDWYSAGCPNVWFSMSGRDINSHRSATGVIVELPTVKTQRAQCYDILKKYYQDQQYFFDPSEMQDTGESYLQVRIN